MARVPAERESIFTLVKKQPGFLTLEEIGAIRYSVFHDRHRCDGASDDSFSLRERFKGADRRFIAFDDSLWMEESVEHIANESLPFIHAEGECLECQIVAVSVDNEAGEKVALAVDKPVGVDAGVEHFP